MKHEISEISVKADELIDQVNYRGFSFSVWCESGDHDHDRCNTRMYYTIIAGKRINICLVDNNYRDRLFAIVDKWLDTVKAWDKDTYLVKFNNGDFVDLKLIYKDRILKIFLVASWSQVDVPKLITESETILKKLNIL